MEEFYKDDNKNKKWGGSNKLKRHKRSLKPSCRRKEAKRPRRAIKPWTRKRDFEGKSEDYIKGYKLILKERIHKVRVLNRMEDERVESWWHLNEYLGGRRVGGKCDAKKNEAGEIIFTPFYWGYINESYEEAMRREAMENKDGTKFWDRV
jgi:hypothetical protein